MNSVAMPTDGNPVAIPRVGQLDADQLDTQVHHLLKDQLTDALSLLPRQDLVSRYDPEITAALHALLLGLSLLRTRRGTGAAAAASYGMYLNQYAYHVGNGRGRAKLWLFALLSVGTPYAWTRVIRTLADARWSERPGWRSQVARLVATRIEPIWNALVLANLLRFLVTGRYPTPLHRLLRLQPVPTRPSTQRNVSFAFLHRQVMWSALTEAILFSLPLYHAARPVVRRWIRGSPRLATLWDALSGGSAKMKQARALLLLPAHGDDREPAICPSCMSNMPQFAANPGEAVASPDVRARCVAMMPVRGTCGCTYCYVCAQARVQEQDEMDGSGPSGKTRTESFACVRCGVMSYGPYKRV